MNERMKAMQAGKRAERRRLAGLPFGEKAILLEKLRDRGRAIAKSSLYKKHHPSA